MPIPDWLTSIKNRNVLSNCQSATESGLKTAKRGRGAQCPDRLITKKRLFHRQFFWE
jgi:hypothetical protein